MALNTFRFNVIGQSVGVPSETKGWSAYLNRDRWDDWGKYCTQFYLTVIDPKGKKYEIGHVKIGQKGLKPHQASSDLPTRHRKPDVPTAFKNLADDFFSVGQDEEYYLNLGALGEEIREHVLKSLHDVAWDRDRWEWAKNEDVTDESLLRSLTASTVIGQFRRLAHGDARVTPYNFTYSPPKRLESEGEPFNLNFNVNPNSAVPTNVHVLIGRNGVGKTRLLSLMTRALIAKSASARQSGKFEFSENRLQKDTFANVVAVSFSAFDDRELLPDRNPDEESLGFSYIGLRGWTSDSPTASIKTKSPTTLAREFVKSLKECSIGTRRERWKNIIHILESDPIFHSAQLTEMIDRNLSCDEDQKEVLNTFRRLSSGHKIVLLTLTRLVEKVEEKTLVLIDEPEGHLHPPLLSAMTRAISSLLVKRNGVAIVATHSPVILQEVPRSCVWILDRLLTVSKAERPSIETFAESIGVLSREVFRLELSQSGYHRILKELRDRFTSYEEAIDEIGSHLGAEGKAVLRGLYLSTEE